MSNLEKFMIFGAIAIGGLLIHFTDNSNTNKNLAWGLYCLFILYMAVEIYRENRRQKYLHAQLVAYLTVWLENLNTEWDGLDNCMDPHSGLCNGFGHWLEKQGGDFFKGRRFLGRLFNKDGLDDYHPFNHDGFSYNAEIDKRLNPKRVEWVRKTLTEGKQNGKNKQRQ